MQWLSESERNILLAMQISLKDTSMLYNAHLLKALLSLLFLLLYFLFTIRRGDILIKGDVNI